MVAPAEILVKSSSDNVLKLVLSGQWNLGQNLPSTEEVLQHLGSSAVEQIIFDSKDISGWDSGLLTFVKRLRKQAEEKAIPLDISGLPQGAQQLLALAAAVPEKKDARTADKRRLFLTILGEETVELCRSAGKLLDFVGAASLAVVQFMRGKATFRKTDLLLMLETCGGQALPIVSLISFLVGLILAFVGAIQLELFGAELYVADLVGIAMVRLMAAIMTGIVMAGRTGGAFAAQLGTMQVNQEIDALRTMGISPMEFLVLPRMLALMIMMPLLCLYANIMGIFGGMVVGVYMLDIGFIQYFNETVTAVRFWDLGIGLFSGFLFGVIVALAGCMRGMECGRSASAVGDAATSAVVTAIVGIIVTTAMITIICNILGI
ncbi:MlaE family ABC transporter permease [Desulfosediminicola flagellatus]|uniref:MlaE family ABC transporter permease n=1 Tax=Desulfosediminicola flagellatus TaxID=2569541 RepID=UPI0010ABC321|nr:ABC transporter permease [Desulfosediminicola flagellatus]